MQWRLNSYQLINAHIDQDAEFGLVRVTGTYSITASSCDWRKPVPELPYTQSGVYRATLIRLGKGTARLLEIKHVP